VKTIGIRAVGAYAPPRILTNADLEKMVQTTDEWIVQRTGIRERRIASDNVFASDLATAAAKDCLSKGVSSPELMISSCGTPEQNFPNQSSLIAARLGLKRLAAFDLNDACSGLVCGVAVARSLMQTNGYRNALVTAGEKMSTYVDYGDRASCILFGDGGSALYLSSDEPEHEILADAIGFDAAGSELVGMGGKGDQFYFRQDGKKVFRFAVTIIIEMIETLKKKAGIPDSEKYFVIPHQANLRIVETVSKHANIPMDHFVMNIDRYGNTSSASIGLALNEAWNGRRFEKGDPVFLIGFGAGLSWAAAALRW
jgi:3-oxoacyl-[acyl-carrier-protein] synthase III